jgi:hypothetical protein
MKTLVGIEVYFHSFLTAALDVEGNVNVVTFVTLLRFPVYTMKTLVGIEV